MIKKIIKTCLQCQERKLMYPNGKYCSRKCYYAVPKSDEFKKKISVAFSGSNHPNWKGGITKGRKERNWAVYQNWRKSVFARDGFTCQMCGIKNEAGLGYSVKLNANHIKTWKNFPELRYNTVNGITLCEKCHDFIKGKEKEFEEYFLFNAVLRTVSKKFGKGIILIKDHREFEGEE